MWAELLLLVTFTISCTDSYIVRDQHERLQHGRRLRIYLPKSTDKLEFVPADDPRQVFVYWNTKSFSRPLKGHVSGSGNDRHWYIDQVTYDDQGTYTQKDFWDIEMSTLKVAVTVKSDFVKRVPGESLSIPLDGVSTNDATLTFSGDSGNFTLVRDGARVSQDIPDFFDRVKTYAKTIEILAVNTSEVGRYRLYDRKERLVSVTRMDLTDHHESSGNPLMALLLLLGIPAGICCCCRKKIFRKKSTSTAHTVQSSPAVILAPTGPSGPCPPYNQPSPGGYYPPQGTDLGPAIHPPPPAPGPQWNGPPPSPGYNPMYPPLNPAYPPEGAPQWNGPPPASAPYPGAYPQGPPAPTAPMGYAAPVFSEAPPPSKGDIKMEDMAPPPTEPLLAPPTQASAVSPDNKDSSNVTNSAATFQIDKNSTNFL